MYRSMFSDLYLAGSFVPFLGIGRHSLLLNQESAGYEAVVWDFYLTNTESEHVNSKLHLPNSTSAERHFYL